MKLYATTTSERASKGQGGNDFLEIVVTGEDGEEMLKLSIRPTMYGYTMQGKSFHRKTDEVFAYDRYIGDEWVSKGSKGERQKGKHAKA